MKKLYSLFLLLLCMGVAPMRAQVITIGTGTDALSSVAFYPLYGNSWMESIYTASEIGMSGNIAMLMLSTVSTATLTCDHVDIYMGHRSDSLHTSTSDWTALSDLTLVYSGTNVSLGALPEEVYVLNTPFAYNGVDNLVVVFAKRAGAWSGNVKYTYTDMGDNLYYSLCRKADGDVTYGVHPGTAPGNLSSLRQNVQLVFSDNFCFPPENLHFTDITSSGCNVSWTGHDGSISYVYQVKTQSEDWSDSVTYSESGTSAILSGLQPYTAYDFRVKGVCESDMSFWLGGSFTTTCEVIMVTNYLPWVEDFTAEPVCWDLEAGVQSWQYSADAQKIFHGYGSYSCEAVSPWLNIAAVTNPYLRITYLKSDFFSSGVADLLEVYYRTSGDDEWMLLNSFENVADEWTTDTLPLPHNITTLQLMLRAIGAGSNADGCSVAELDVYNEVNTSLCVAPSGLHAFNVTPTSADLTWHSFSSDTVNLYYIAEDADTYTMVSGVTLVNDVYTLGGLTANTHYSWHVSMVCDDGTTRSSAESSFYTHCLPVSQLPFSEDFDNVETLLPDCWRQINPYLRYPNVSVSGAHSGKSLVFECGTSPVYAVMPQLTSDLSELQVSFWTRREGVSSGTFSVGYVTDPTDAATFVPMWSISGATIADNDYHYYTVPFNDMTTVQGQTYFIAFKYDANVSWFWYLDDVLVEEIPACQAPTDLSVSDIQSNQANLHWSANGSNFTLYYRTEDASEWSVVENVPAIGSEGYTLTNLASTTVYHWCVAVVCEDGTLSNSNVSTFMTSCGVYNTPFVETFNTSDLPDCWSRYDGLVSAVFAGTEALVPVTTGWYFNNTNVFGQYHAKINIYGTSCKSWLVTPGIDLTGMTNPVLTFDLALTDFANSSPIENPTDQIDDKFMVIVSTDNGLTWSPANATVWSNDGAGDYSYNEIATGGEEVMISLAAYIGLTVKIAFYSESQVSNGDNDLHVDNVQVKEMASCPRPALLTASVGASGSVILSWDEVGNASAWNIEYGHAGFTQGSAAGIVVHATTNPYTVSGLTAATSYDFYVQADCGETQSLWRGPVTATPGIYEMPIYGSDTITTCDVVIYDNGGPTHDYSSGCQSTLVIYPETEEGKISISGTYSLENCCDYLQIYDGVGTDGILLAELKGLNHTVSNVISSSGPVTLLFHTDNSQQYAGFALDVSCVTCLPPTNLSVDGVTTQSADLIWSSVAGTNSWQVSYKSMMDTDWTSMVVTDTFCTISGLAGGTNYEVNVYSLCQDEVYSVPAMLSFNTQLVPAELPYFTDFSDTADRLWVLNNGSCINYWTIGTLTDSTNALFVTTNGTTPDYDVNNYSVVTVEKLFTVGTASDLVVSFDAKIGGESVWDYMKLFLAPDTVEYPAATSSQEYSAVSYDLFAADFSDYLQYTGNQNIPYKLNLTSGNTIHVEVLLHNPNVNATDASTAKLVFLWHNDGGFGTPPGAIISNVSVTIDTCPIPVDLAVSQIGMTDAVVTWTAGGNETSWIVEYQQANDSPWTAVSVSETSYTLTGLTSGTNYNVRVSSDCGTDTSNSVEISFMTEYAAVVVTTNAATDIAQTSASISGTVTNPDNAPITSRGFVVTNNATGNQSEFTVTSTVSTFTSNLTNLTPATEYVFKAFVTIGDNTVYGSELSFTTLPEDIPEPCDAPTGLTVTNVTHGSVTVTWDNSGAAAWSLVYRTQNETQWTELVGITTNSCTITGLQPETQYEIRVRATCEDGVTSDYSTSVFVTTQPNGVGSWLENSVTLFPNPANEVVNVQCTMNNVHCQSVEVIDVYGKVIRTSVGANNYSPLQTIQINVSGLATGMYFVRVTTDAGVVTKSFVKQ